MNFSRIKKLRTRLLAAATLVCVILVPIAAPQHDQEWTWKDSSGRIRTRAELEGILADHEQWLQSKRKLGARAILRGAQLLGADLGRRRGEPNLREADLRGADLSWSEFETAHLDRADLSGTDLTKADFKEATLYDASLANARLAGTNLSEAALAGAKLNGAALSVANLTGADLRNADLTGAHFFYSNLSGADLRWADLNGASFQGVDLRGTVFDPITLPDIRSIADAQHLEFVTYLDSPYSLVQLRKEFQDGGFLEQERKITYALSRRNGELRWEECRQVSNPFAESRVTALVNCAEHFFALTLFDWTCQYGMSPGRPLAILGGLWFLCSVFYLGCIHSSGGSALYLVYAESPVRPAVRLSMEKIRPLPATGFLRRELRLLGTAMFFSLMSAFNIGFKEIAVGRWLRLLTKQEFDMKAMGWARVVAGYQTLISFYMLVLWVLTYFGRPFQ